MAEISVFLCPNCRKSMDEVFILIGGGVWISRSEEEADAMLSFVRDGRNEPHEIQQPVICLVGKSGYRKGRWPKKGLYCSSCEGLFLKTRS